MLQVMIQQVAALAVADGFHRLLRALNGADKRMRDRAAHARMHRLLLLAYEWCFIGSL